MARVLVFYALMATAFVIFVTFSPTIKHGRPSSALNRRLGYRFPIPNFDPLVVKMHRLAKEKGCIQEGNPNDLEKNSYAAEVEEAGEFLSDGIRLNITLRLLVLFPFIDKQPQDGLISLKELETWNVEQAIDRLADRSRKEIESRDTNNDMEISFHEFLPQFSKEDIEKNEMGHGEAGWWMEQFRNADVDRNGTLNFDEFNNFLHPEDSNNEEILKWILRENIKRMDDDRDGKLNLAEFSKYAYDAYKIYTEYETNYEANVRTAEEKFSELDKNMDEFLTEEELIPMIEFLKPGELSYAKYYTKYLIHEADENGDDHLSLDEMLKHENTFYEALADDYQDFDDEFHDEL